MKGEKDDGGRTDGRESPDEPEKYSRGDRPAKRDDDSSPRGKFESAAGAANGARRGERAPAIATNYASTELNLKDRLARKKGGRSGGRAEGRERYTCGP